MARIAKCLKARAASRTTTSPLRGKSLTPPSPSNERNPSHQGLLTTTQKSVTCVSERTTFARSNNAVTNCNQFLVLCLTKGVQSTLFRRVKFPVI